MALPKYGGGLADYLNENTRSAISSTGTRVENIDFQNLIPHENNFYGMRDIPSLAKDMRMSNWVEPLRVQKTQEPGKYIILSGERRYRAVMYRYEHGEIESREIPCVVTEAPAGNGLLTAEMQTDIAIIMANSHRVKNFSEKLQEIEVLEPMARIYYQKAKDEGSYAGAFRDYFAEQILNISATQLQRLRSLRSLLDDFLCLLDEGKITRRAAEELARHTADEQMDFQSAMKSFSRECDFDYDDVVAYFHIPSKTVTSDEPEKSDGVAETAENGNSSQSEYDEASEPVRDNPVSGIDEGGGACAEPDMEDEPEINGSSQQDIINEDDDNAPDTFSENQGRAAEYGREEEEMPSLTQNTKDDGDAEPAATENGSIPAKPAALDGIANSGMAFVVKYLQKGMKESEEMLLIAREDGDEVSIAQYEMEVASFKNAIVRLSH
ncbi:ParB/RepB/Spo0J family partition protein [Anaerovibrio sp.]|uniref:ParB/RepB/Spo0J family partition protein n=1 Tax=Anaerovibrio sp. TaxID=1872532 RepID=UPI003F1653C1